MSKKHKKKHKKEFPTVDVTPSAKKPFNFKLLGIVAMNTVVLFSFYRVAMNINPTFFKVVLAIYLAATSVLAIAYVLYNRGFSRRGVTSEMLPDTMSAEQKCEFIADGERRLKKSKWMLTVLFPMIVIFMWDIIEIYLLDYIKALLG